MAEAKQLMPQHIGIKKMTIETVLNPISIVDMVAGIGFEPMTFGL